MKIRKFKFEVRITDIDNEKWNNEVTIKAVSFNQASKEFWNTLSEHFLLEELVQITITNIPQLRRI